MKEINQVINNNPSEAKRRKLVGLIFVIWFVGSLIAMVWLSKINPNYCIMVFGQYFLVLGMFPLFGKGKNRIIGVPFVLVGLACIIIPYLMTKPEINGTLVNWDTVIVTLLLIAFVIAGLFLVIMSVKKAKRQKRLCSKEVIATVIKHGTVYDNETGRRLHYPIFAFEFNGNKYEVESQLAKNVGVKPIGTVVSLKVNPDNPEEFLDKGAYSVPLILGIVFLVVSIPSFILFLQNASFIK